MCFTSQSEHFLPGLLSHDQGKVKIGLKWVKEALRGGNWPNLASGTILTKFNWQKCVISSIKSPLTNYDAAAIFISFDLKNDVKMWQKCASFLCTLISKNFLLELKFLRQQSKTLKVHPFSLIKSNNTVFDNDLRTFDHETN